MNFFDALKSHMQRDKVKHGVDCSNNNETSAMINSYDSALRPVTRHYDRTILTQTIRMVTRTLIETKNKNLSAPNHLLTIMSINGKECADTVDAIFNKYFQSKADISNKAKALNRERSNNIASYELHEVKFVHAMCNRNWDRSFFPLLS